MHISKKLVIGLLGVLLLAGAGIWASPYISIHQMRQAAKAGDSEALSKKVNFPVLRDNIKIKLMSTMNENMKGLEGNPFAGFAQIMAVTLVNGIVDAYVSPAGIALMLDGRKPKPEAQANAKPLAPAGQGTAPQEQPSASKVDSSSEQITDVKYEYLSFDRFRASVSNSKTPDDHFSLIFDRDGLFNWKLVNIDFPGVPK